MSETVPIATVNKETTVRGKSVSGRLWKGTRKPVHSLNSTQALVNNNAWGVKSEILEKKKRAKAYENELKEKKHAINMQKQQQRKDSEARRLVNERKGEVVQYIKNTKKVKMMSSKQRKQLQTR